MPIISDILNRQAAPPQDEFGGVIVDPEVRDEFGGIVLEPPKLPSAPARPAQAPAPPAAEPVEPGMALGDVLGFTPPPLSPYQKLDVESMAQGLGRPDIGPYTGGEAGRVAGMEEVSRGLRDIPEKIFTPLYEAAPKISREDLEKFLLAVTPSMPLAMQRQRITGGAPMERMPKIKDVSPEGWRAISIATGVEHSLADTVNFFTSPLGIATLGMGALPKTLHTAIAAAFTFDMARQAPEIAKELGAELGKPKDQQDPEKIANLITTGVTATGFTVLGALGATKQGREWLAKKSAEREAFFGPSAFDLPASAEAEAIIRSSPESAQRYKPGGLFTDTTRVLPDEAPFPRPASILKERIRRGEATLEELEQFIREEVGVKPPRPEVPVVGEKYGLPPGMEEAPAPAAPVEELVTFEDFVSDFKRRGRADMTIAEIQALYPQIFEGGRNREGARRLRDEAFPREKEAPKKELTLEEQKEQEIKDRIAAGLDPEVVQIVWAPGRTEVIGEGRTITTPTWAQVDEVHPSSGPTGKPLMQSSNLEQMRRLGYDVPTIEELTALNLPPGRYKLTQIRELLKMRKLSAPAEARRVRDIVREGQEKPPVAPGAEKPPVTPKGKREPQPGDYERWNALAEQARKRPPNMEEIWAEMEDIKSSYGGYPPKPPPAPAPAAPPPPPTPAEAPATPPPPTPPPVTPTATVTPPVAAPPTPGAPPPIKPTGLFGQDAAKDALGKLKLKKPPQPPPPEAVEGVVRPAEELSERAEAEIERLRMERERGQPQAAGEAGETPKMFPGEPKAGEVALYDQETLGQLTTVGGTILESGVIDFISWHKAMTEMVGPEYRHYFRRTYNQLRDVPALYDLAKQMTPREDVELYNDAGERIGLGAKHRPGLIVRNENLIPAGDRYWVDYIVPNRWIGPEGDSIDWTQAKAAVMTMTARTQNKPAVMIADGPGVGKSGIGAIIAHLLTYPVRESLDSHMGKIWEASTPEARVRWLGVKTEPEGFMPDYGAPGTPEVRLPLDLRRQAAERMGATSWDMLRPEQKSKVYKNYGFKEQQIAEDNVFAGGTERRKVLVIGNSKPHIETSFIPDFQKFGIPMDHIEFVTYSLFSNPGAPGSPSRLLFERIINTEWAGIILDEAQALKNAGSSREHNFRKLKTPFKVFMTATPMDNVPNAAYFMAEITGKTREQVFDQLGLRRIVKTIGGEDREFIVQKPGISAHDVTAAIIRMREQAIANGQMIRREFPWWGDVIGEEKRYPIDQHMSERWNKATPEQRAEWIYADTWDGLTLEQRADLLLPTAGAEMPDQRWSGVSAARREYADWELRPIQDLKWADLNSNQKSKIGQRAFRGLDWNQMAMALKLEAEERPGQVYQRAGYSPKEIRLKTAIIKGEPGPYWLEELTPEEKAEEQRIFDSYEKEIQKSKSAITRRNLSGMRTQELKRWAESIKAKRAIGLILKELEDGRNVVIYSNTINPHYVKGLGESIWHDVPGVPNADWPRHPGALGLISEELTKLNIPFSQIYGPVKDLKTKGIREFYNNENRVAIITPESGGAGLNLDDVIGRYPRTLIVIDLTFKGDTFEQMMYRVSRRNTASASKAHLLMFRNSIADANIRRKMNHKLAVLRGIQAGRDTDFAEFLNDLNNPADMKVPDNKAPKLDEMKGEFPPMKWEEIVGKKGGKRRWRAEITKEFEDWWNANGGKKNPLKLYRTEGGRYYKKEYVWSDSRPEFNRPAEPDAPSGDPELMASSLGGYKNPSRYSGYDYDDLVQSIDTFQTLVDEGVDVGPNSKRVAEMKDELSRRHDVDDRTDEILKDDPEFQELTESIEKTTDANQAEELERQRTERVGEIAEEVSVTAPTTPPAVQPILSPPGTVPTAVVPGSLVGPVRSMYAIANDLKKGLGIPIQFGSHIGGGFYDPLRDYARVKHVSDYEATFHEAGHKLDDTFQFRKMGALDAELMLLGDPSVPGSRSSWRPGKSKDYRRGEGVAEFIRRWVFDPPTATAMAPNFSKVWEALIDANEKELGFMRALKKDVAVFRSAPDYEKFRTYIMRDVPAPMGRRYSLASLTNEFLDQYHYIKIISDYAFDVYSRLGGLKPSQDPYILYRLLAGNFGRAEAWIRYGQIDGKTGDIKLGSSLQDAIAPVKDRLEDFENWMVAVQAGEMLRKGQDPGIPANLISSVLTKFQGDPAFTEAFNRIQLWQDSLLRYTLDLGLISPLDFLRMKRENAIYVPMRRFFELGYEEAPVQGGAGGGRQPARIGRPSSLRYRHGGERPIMSPLASMIENAYWMTFAAEKNRALTSLVDLSNLPQMGHWIRPMPAPQEKVMFQFGRIRKQLKDLGISTAGVSDDTLMFFWRTSHGEVIGKNQIRVKRGEGYEYYELHPDLFKSVMASDKIAMSGLMRLIAAPAQVLRSGVTLDPTFAFWRNIIRDTVSAAVISRFTILPFEASIRGAWALLSPKLMETLGFKNHADAMRTIVAEWKASGAEHAVEASYFDRNKLQKFFVEEMGKQHNYASRGLFIVKHPIQALRLLTQVGEQSTRIGEYQKVFNSLKNEPGWSRLDAHLQAAFEARDLQDFSMQGNNVAYQTVKMLTAFWNAAIQGRYRFYRSLVDSRRPDAWKGVLWKGGLYVMLPKLMEQYMNWDNEDYWSQPRWQRSLFYHIPIAKTDNGRTQFLLVPVPFEAGLIFASIPGAILEYAKERNVDSLKAFGSLFAEQNVDMPVPQFLSLLFELTPDLGYDYFQNRPLMARGMEKEPYWARWNDTTSLTARKVGKLMNTSPAKLEHAMRRTTGGLGTTAVHQGMDRILELVTGERGAPIPAAPLRSIITPPPGTRSQIVEDFYDKLNRLSVEERARTEYNVRNPKISTRELDSMIKTERAMAAIRREYRGTYDEAKRERLTQRMEALAKEHVRTKEGRYKP